MKRLHFSSFRQRLNAAFLAVSLVPMLLCSGLLLQIFRLRMTSNAQQTAQQQLSTSCEALDTLHSGFLQTAASLQHNPLVAQALFDAEAEDTAVYNPDGKEIIARDNEVSIQRKTDVGKAYLGCHTAITIPYEELGSIEVLCADGSRIPIIQNGRFVLEGTEELNEPLEHLEE